MPRFPLIRSRLAAAAAVASVAVAGVLARPAAAQDQAAPPVEIRALALGENIKDLSYLNAGEVAKLDAYARGIAPATQYRGPSEIRFFQGPIEEGKQPAATAKLPAGAKKVLLLFAPDESAPGKLSVRAFPNDEARMPEGGYRILNLSKLPVSGTLGGVSFAAKPGEATVIRKPGRLGEYRNLDVKIRREVRRETKVIYSAVWGFHPARRTTVIITDNASKAEEITVRKFGEVDGAEKGAAE